MKSMTGYSRVEKYENGIKAIVEIKSLNSKYLDINCKLPKTLFAKELEIRDQVKKTIVRGTVTVSISTEFDYSLKPFKLNENNAFGIYNSLVELSKKLKLRSNITISDILSFPNYLLVEENTNFDNEREWEVAKSALVEALHLIDKYRMEEGKNLSKDISNRAKKLKEILNKIIQKSINRIEEEREKLRRKVAMLFESDEIDENRLQFEILLMANRLDINEECARLDSHIKFLKDAIKSKEPVGQKINFIIQEINREFNTIGSKSDNVEISHLVVQAKEEIEKIREMVMNIE
ncbi:MAG: YicC family protein [Ignavibacteria bacterium]|nr:YicC family protein [Ignavibacteria bacterium]